MPCFESRSAPLYPGRAGRSPSPYHFWSDSTSRPPAGNPGGSARLASFMPLPTIGWRPTRVRQAMTARAFINAMPRASSRFRRDRDNRLRPASAFPRHPGYGCSDTHNGPGSSVKAVWTAPPPNWFGDVKDRRPGPAWVRTSSGLRFPAHRLCAVGTERRQGIARPEKAGFRHRYLPGRGHLHAPSMVRHRHH